MWEFEDVNARKQVTRLAFDSLVAYLLIGRDGDVCRRILD